MNLFKWRKLRLLVGAIFIFSTPFELYSQLNDTIYNKNNVLELGVSSFRAPYGVDSTGNVIPHVVHKAKLSYGIIINRFLSIKAGFTYYNSTELFTPRKNSFGFDIQTILLIRIWHAEIGLHCSNYTESVTPAIYDPSFAQYLSFGTGLTFPIKNRWAIGCTFRNSFNVTFQQNTFSNLPEGFISIFYHIRGNNNYLRRKMSCPK